MYKLIISCVLLSVLSMGYCDAPPYKQCKGQNFEDLENRIEVIPCGPKKCKLVKETNITVIFKFNPNETVTELRNNVSATLVGMLTQIPFLGVTGTNACPDVRLAASGDPAPCPLAPGTEYIYTTYIPVLSIFPLADLTVHWSLDSGDRTLICFEVPASIVRATSKNLQGTTEATP